MLLELMFSLAVFSLGILAVMRALTIGLEAKEMSQDITRAMLLAQSKMTEVEALSGRRKDVLGEESQIAQQSFRWQAEIRRLETAEGILDLVELSVRWERKGRPREVEVVSLFLPKTDE